MTPLANFTGRLVLRPGRPDAVRCDRPMVGARLLDRLTVGRSPMQVPEVIAAVFTLCAHAQRGTSRRAIRAAMGRGPAARGAGADADDPAASPAMRHEARQLSLDALREHLRRFAIDLVAASPVDGIAADLGWLRDLPDDSVAGIALADAGGLDARVSAWLRTHLFGLSAGAWLDGWDAGGADWLARWSRDVDHPLARWLDAIRDEAMTITWPCRPLDVLRDPDAGPGALARSLAADPSFAHRPSWRGAAAETGPWTREARRADVRTAWDRLGARLAEVAWIGAGGTLAIGALATADGEGIGWTETSRGLLVHWARVAPGDDAADRHDARIIGYRVLAPTEWNFHPDGAFAAWLRASPPDPGRASLAAASLDPCLECTIEDGIDA